MHGALNVPKGATDGAPDALRSGDLSPSAAAAALTAFADVTVLVDRDGLIKAAAFGVDRGLAAELALPAGGRWSDLLAPDSAAKGRDLLAAARLGEPARPREVNHQGAAAGRTLPVRYLAVAQEGGDVLLLGKDLQAQAELQRQLVDAQQAMERDYSRLRGVETRYRVLFQLGDTPMLIVDAGNRKVLEANAACLAHFALSAQRMAGRSLASLFDEHDGEALQGLFAAALRSGEAEGAVLRAAAGEQRFALSAHLFRQDGGSLLLLQARPLAGAGAPTESGALGGLIDRLPEGFAVTDGEGLVLEANRTFLDLAELPMAAAAAGQSLGRWLGRTAVDLGVLIASLQEHGAVRGFATVMRGGFGAEEPVEVSAVRLGEAGGARIGFLIRAANRAGPAARAVTNLPRSLDQMKELVGNVPLKELVRETTDVIERLCIEAALELTNDNRASAAELLGLSRQSLYAKLHRFGLGDLGPEQSA